jgi:hypothetical protein
LQAASSLVTATRPQAGAALPQRRRRESFELAAEIVGGGHDQRLEHDNRLRSGLDGDIADDLDLADHLARALRASGRRTSPAGQHRPRRVLGVDHVRLAALAPITAVWAACFEDRDIVATQVAHQALTVAAGPLDPEPLGAAKRPRPRKQLLIAARVRRDRQCSQTRAGQRERHGDVEVLMRIDTNNDALLLVCHPVLLDCPDWWSCGWSGGKDRTVTGTA